MDASAAVFNGNLLFQTRHAIEKVLDWENSHLFHKVSFKKLVSICSTNGR